VKSSINKMVPAAQALAHYFAGAIGGGMGTAQRPLSGLTQRRVTPDPQDDRPMRIVLGRNHHSMQNGACWDFDVVGQIRAEIETLVLGFGRCPTYP
jgi:hypothetical protein